MFLQSELEFEPRYPLFGGWKATFVIGYGLPLEDFLFESPDGRRYLNFTFGCPLVDTVVNKLTIKVSLVTWVCIHIVAVLIFPHIASRLMFEIWTICLLPCHIPGCTARGIKRPFCCHSFPRGAASGGNQTCQFTCAHTGAEILNCVSTHVDQNLPTYLSPLLLSFFKFVNDKKFAFSRCQNSRLFVLLKLTLNGLPF